MLWRSAVLPTLALALAACGRAPDSARASACDDAALERAALELEGGSVNARSQAIDALEAACPTLEPSIVRGLELAYVPDRPPETAALAHDSRLRAAQRGICDDREAWREAAALGPGFAGANAVFEACGLVRHGLLEADERFLPTDFNGFVAHAWLLSHGVDRGIARRFVRGMLSATSSPAAAATRCRRDAGDYACVLVARAAGVELPRSSSRATPSLEPWHQLSRESLRIEGRDEVVRLEGGAFRESDLEGHIVVPLRNGLLLARFDDPIQFMVDGEVGAGALLRVLYTIDQLGISRLTLATEGVESTRVIGVQSPGRWSNSKAHELPRVSVRVDPKGVRISAPTIGSRALAAGDLATLAGLAHEIAEAEDDPTVSLHLADSVPLTRVVAILDALRGPECMPDRLDFEPGCDLALPVIGFDPPLGRRPGDWSRLRLELTSALGVPEVQGPIPVAKLRDQVEAGLPEISRCLRESRPAAIVMPEWVGYLFWVNESGTISAQPLLPDLYDTPLNACLAAAIGLDQDRDADAEYYATVEITIDVPQAHP